MALAASLLVAIPLIVALLSAVLGYRELRDALTYDVRGLAALTLRTDAQQQLLRQDATLRAGLRSGRRRALARVFAAQPQLDRALRALPALVGDLDVPGGREAAARLQSFGEAWQATVVRPLTRNPPASTAARAALASDNRIVNQFRVTSRGLGRDIRARIVEHQKSFAKVLFRIAVLFFASVTMCAIGVFAGVWRVAYLDRERERAESTLHEREVLHERDRSWARLFARAVLPPALPVVAGCRFDAVYEPGQSDQHVGGDWYDAVRLIDGRILISIGDVAGSGIEAAVVMGAARQIMRGIAQVHADPALMLDAADRALRIEHQGVFVTAWVGIIDLVTRRLSFSSAGHPPALLYTAQGGLRELRDTALPLGLRQSHEGRTTSIDLVDGATIVLYTDGLTEATRDVIAGEALVRSAVSEMGKLRGSKPASFIERRVLTAGSSDDVAILVARIDLTDAERFIRRTAFDANDARAARAARDLLDGVLADRAFDAGEIFDAHVVFGELVGNVARHAGRPEVAIAIDGSGPQIVLHVFDRGPAFRPAGRVVTGVYADSGRGLSIVSAVTEEFSVSECEGGGNHVRATLRGGTRRPLPWSRLERQAASAPAPSRAPDAAPPPEPTRLV